MNDTGTERQIVKHERLVCSECGWRGNRSLVDVVYDPRPLYGDKAAQWLVCPSCRTIEHMYEPCDEPHCWEKVCCGTPTPDGYRSTCATHAPVTL